MKRFMLWLVVAMLVVAAPSLIPRTSPQAATQEDQRNQGLVTELPAEVGYKSSSDRHKIRITDPKVLEMLKARQVRSIGDYGAFAVVEVDTATAEELTGNRQGEWRDDYNVIMLNATLIDTTSDSALKLQEAGAGESSGRRLHLVHFPGPIMPEGYDALLKTGVEIVTYIPNNAYLVYGDRTALRRIRNAARVNGLLQWEAPYGEAMKIDPAVAAQLEPGKGPRDGVTAQESKEPKSELPETNLFAIQLFKDSENEATLDLINKVKTEEITSEFEILQYHNVIVAVPPETITTIAKRPDVISIQPYIMPQKRDERQNQIMAGNITGNLPNAADYLAYLTGKGFTQAQFTASGFAVDVSDDGLENGTVNIDHPNLRVGGIAAGATRVVYNRLETSGGFTTPGRTGFEGHGNLNTHIIGGFVNFAFGSGFPHADAAGFRFGLGIAPFVRVGQSAIFNPGFTSPNFANLQSRAYADGARISSNSWGANTGGAYTVSAQAYDALVRDAQPAGSAIPTAGNQEMVIIFSAGNAGSGANTVGDPGTGKNVITVGAAENVHSHSTANGGNNAAGNDGCGIGDTGADSANDIIAFSSRGPCDDGRKKPDIVGPGTHVTGGVAQAPMPGVNGTALPTFNSLGVCALPGSGVAGDPDNFFPLGQQWYTTSSGTSHSAPAVAGAAALVRQHFINMALTPPSPAMTKGILLNSARYMTGVGANDALWSNNQGMGAANLNSFFDIFATTNIIRDQLGADTFTATGQSRVFTGNVVDNTRPFRVTIAWTDAPGPTSGNAFINNLDLEVTVGGQTYKGNVFVGANSATGGTADPRNNVECVFVPAGVSGPFVVRVLATNIAGDGVPNSGGPLDQDFALVISNAEAVDQAVIAGAGATITTESCTPANGAIDPNETVTVSFCLQNIGTLNTTNLVGTLGATGGVTSPSGPQNYGVVVAGGAVVCRNFTFTAADLACGGTLTATLQLQDGATNLGTVTFTFTIGGVTIVGPTAFSNSASITIPDVPGGPPDLGVPYPSSINVAGLTGSVSKVTVTLTNISHTFPDDIDILLVGPGGQGAIIMSDAGLGSDIVNVTLTFDDAAASQLPDSAQIVSGTFQPTNFATGDVFPAPAPGGPFGSPLSVFNGTNPNGTWNLFVVDDAGVDAGNIAGGWTLNITTAEPLCSTSCGQCELTCPANVTVSNDPNQCGAVVNYPPPTTVGACGTVMCSPATNSFFPVGTTTVTCTAAPETCIFTVTVNDTQPPSITCPANVTAVTALTCPATTATAVSFPDPTASDNCPGVTVACVPASGSIIPVGTTTVTCTATDASGNTATCSFTVTVFDVCLQDDSNPANKLLINSFTGDYRFICNGDPFVGRGKITGLGCDKQLAHNPSDKRVRANWSSAVKRGNASLQAPPGTNRCTIADSNMTNNDCATGLAVPEKR